MSPYLPTKKLNYYWGYDVRIAKSLSKALGECPFGDKYDLIIGTSDKGDSLENVQNEVTDFKHALIVFGGLKGLVSLFLSYFIMCNLIVFIFFAKEFSMSNDAEIEKDKNVKDLFSYYLNAIPFQTTGTVRTEEACFIIMSILSGILLK